MEATCATRKHHDMIHTAMNLTMSWHASQLDKAGKPYVLHPIRVMAALGPNEMPEVQAAALLHDILEDTKCPEEEILQLFPSETFSMVMSLTKREGEEYFDYIRRVARNTMCNYGARRIKVADLNDNVRADRYVKGMNLYQRYFRALAIIEGREE